MDEPGDRFCIINSLEGKTEFFGILVRRYQNHLFNIVNNIVKNSDASEDIVQEAFLRAYRSLKNFDIDRELFPYLVRISVNCAKDYLKKYHNEVDFESETADSLDTSYDYGDLYDAIYSLPEDFKEVILFYYRDGKSIKEIATIVNRTPENVKVQLFRARKLLFEKLNS